MNLPRIRIHEHVKILSLDKMWEAKKSMNLRRLTLHRFEVPCSHLHLAPVSIHAIDRNEYLCNRNI